MSQNIYCTLLSIFMYVARKIYTMKDLKQSLLTQAFYIYIH